MNKDVLEQLKEIYKEYQNDTTERQKGEFESITDFIYYLVTNNYSVVKEAK
jgi:hypothetical protein